MRFGAIVKSHDAPAEADEKVGTERDESPEGKLFCFRMECISVCIYIYMCVCKVHDWRRRAPGGWLGGGSHERGEGGAMMSLPQGRFHFG